MPLTQEAVNASYPFIRDLLATGCPVDWQKARIVALILDSKELVAYIESKKPENMPLDAGLLTAQADYSGYVVSSDFDDDRFFGLCSNDQVSMIRKATGGMEEVNDKDVREVAHDNGYAMDAEPVVEISWSWLANLIERNRPS